MKTKHFISPTLTLSNMWKNSIMPISATPKAFNMNTSVLCPPVPTPFFNCAFYKKQ